MRLEVPFSFCSRRIVPLVCAMLLLLGGGPAFADAALRIGSCWTSALKELEARQKSGDETPVEDASTELALSERKEPRLRAKARRGRHIDIGVRWNHPHLGETKDLLERRLETPLRLDWARGFEHPYTPIDRRTDWGFVSLYLGMGREISDYVVWNVYAGGSAGDDRNDDRFLISTLDVNFEYRFFFVGFNVEVYPWKQPQVRRAMDFLERLMASRPFVMAGLETGYVHGDGDGVFKMLYVPAYRDRVHIRDWVTSFLIGLGWDFPISPELSVNVAGDYKFHFYRPDEYNGWNLLTGLRYKF